MKTNIYRTLIVSIAMLVSQMSQGQLVNLGSPVNTGERSTGFFASVNSGNDIWTVSQVYDSSVSNWITKISKHNGLFWSDVHTFQSVPSPYREMNACFFNGDLYFNAAFDQLVLNSVTYGKVNAILKWDGNNVSFIDSVRGQLSDMDTFNNRLVVTGWFHMIGSTLRPGLAQYDGSTWSDIDTVSEWVNFQPGMIYYGGQAVRQGNKLFITGNFAIFDTLNPKKYQGLAVYDGTNLKPLPRHEFGDSSFMGGEIYVHPDSSGFYVNDSSYKTFYREPGKLRKLINAEKNTYLVNYVFCDKYAYRDSSVFVLKPMKGYPITNAPCFIDKYTGRRHRRIYLPDYLRADYTYQMGMFGEDKVFFVLHNNNSGRIEFFRLDSNENLSATISGKAYIDIDMDCIHDAGEPLLKNKWLTLSPGNRPALTDDKGNYLFAGLSGGLYQVNFTALPGRIYSCPSGGSYSDSLASDSNVTRNFALKFDSAYTDLAVHVVSFRGLVGRRGFSEKYEIIVTNNSYLRRNGSANIALDNGLKGVNGTNVSFTGNAGLFNFANLDPGHSVKGTFTCVIDTNVAFNTMLKMYATLDTSTQNWDSIPSNDKDTIEITVVGSYDPNEKISKPSGGIPKGTRHIQYHINFQNLGNDTAFRVVVVDTIDLRLPLEKIVLGSSSHPYKLKVFGNILVFEFDDIKLVDSATNEPGSKGYLRFSAQLPANLSVGSSVHNMASIYFDYNRAVETNYASVRIIDFTDIREVHPGEKGMLIHPNPSTGKVRIEKSDKTSVLTIFNTNGKMVFSDVIAGAEAELDLSLLPSGIYMALTTEGESSKFVILH